MFRLFMRDILGGDYHALRLSLHPPPPAAKYFYEYPYSCIVMVLSLVNSGTQVVRNGHENVLNHSIECGTSST